MPAIPVTPGQLPIGFCPADYQSLLNGFSQAQSVVIPDTAEQIIASPNKPADQSVVWLQLDSLSRPVRMYIFAQGAWLSQHTLAPGFTMMWFAPLPDFTIFDGGDANAPGQASGPMWQQAKDNNGNLIQARFALSAGTLPSGAVVAQSGTGGEEAHTLLSAEGAQDPNHRHVWGKFIDDTNDNHFGATGSDSSALPARKITPNSGNTAVLNLNDPSLTGQVLETDKPAGAASSVSPHNNMPPWIGCYFLQRSNRLYYAVT